MEMQLVPMKRERQQSTNAVSPFHCSDMGTSSHTVPNRQMLANYDAAEAYNLLVPSRMLILISFYCIHTHWLAAETT